MLQRRDVAFFRGSQQLTWDLRSATERVEVRFRCSEGDQFRKGVAVGRVPDGSDAGLHAGGGAVVLLVELLSLNLHLPANAPLASYRMVSSEYAVISQNTATRELRELVANAGMQPHEFALHPLRIRGATQLSAVGVASGALKRQGRWNSDAYKVYFRIHARNAGRVPETPANINGYQGSQPGIDTQ